MKPLKKSIHEFIGTLEVSETIKSELLQITPSNFLEFDTVLKLRNTKFPFF
jgi:hypothetical protein